MKKYNKILWGLVLVIVGVILGTNALEITNIELFFDGWWTLFIIVPSLIGLFTERDKTGNLIGLVIGVVLLLTAQGIFNWALFWDLVIPVIIIIIGLRMILGANKTNKKFANAKFYTNEDNTVYSAVFKSEQISFKDKVFRGADLDVVFGNIDLDLRQALIENDFTINVSSVFAGVNIYLPDYVNLEVNSTGIFGGTDYKKHVNRPENTITLYLKTNNVFGGVNIK